MRHRISKVHFIGIGGAGMCGIAEVLNSLGYQVSGSDLVEGAAVQRLREQGIEVVCGHDAGNIDGKDAVVVSSAISSSNPELAAARQLGLPVVPRAKMLNELLRLGQGIAVAGSHGKTTITSMIAGILHEGGLDPTYVVGGRVHRFGSSAALGKGDFIVVETDESDGSFLHLSPVIAVASNIDADHLQAYGQDLRRLKRAFIEFFDNLPFYGVAIICIDDPALRDVGAMISNRVISYGIENPAADFRAHSIRAGEGHTEFTLESPGGQRSVRMRAIGEHNVANALAAFAVAHEVNVAADAAVKALEDFAGVERRLENHGEIGIAGKQVLLVDDYGHHPTEINASLGALAKAYPRRRLVLVFQPHRYSRTRDHFDALADALAAADVLVLADVYAAGEQPIAAATGQDLAHAVRLRGLDDVMFVPELDDIPARLATLVQPGDLVAVMGAGTIGKVCARLVEGRS